MEKNIWEYVMNSKGEVIEKVADYIGVKSFAKTIEGLYRECLENFDDAEDMEEYIADLYGKNIQSLAWEFTHKVIRDFTPNELKNEDVRDELTEELEEDDFINLLENCKDIAFYEWSSSGYSQGDYVRGYAYCDKERFKKMVDTNTKNWKNRAIELFESEVKNIGMWMWGDVKSYVLEKKRPYTKLYEDGKSSDSYEWEQIESCCGEYFEDADDLIEEVIKEHGLQTKDAA